MEKLSKIRRVARIIILCIKIVFGTYHTNAKKSFVLWTWILGAFFVRNKKWIWYNGLEKNTIKWKAASFIELILKHFLWALSFLQHFFYDLFLNVANNDILIIQNNNSMLRFIFVTQLIFFQTNIWLSLLYVWNAKPLYFYVVNQWTTHLHTWIIIQSGYAVIQH